MRQRLYHRFSAAQQKSFVPLTSQNPISAERNPPDFSNSSSMKARLACFAEDLVKIKPANTSQTRALQKDHNYITLGQSIRKNYDEQTLIKDNHKDTQILKTPQAHILIHSFCTGIK